MSKFARKWKKEIEIEDDDDDEPIAEKFLVNQLTPEDVFLYFCLFILNILKTVTSLDAQLLYSMLQVAGFCR